MNSCSNEEIVPSTERTPVVKIKPTLSDCCQGKLIPCSDGQNSDDTYDRCDKCNRIISYVLAGRWHEESLAVCRLFGQEGLWFFWQQTSNWNSVIKSNQEYIGQMETVVDSITSRQQKDADMIEHRFHKGFSNEYKHKVNNPQYAL